MSLFPRKSRFCKLVNCVIPIFESFEFLEVKLCKFGVCNCWVDKQLKEVLSISKFTREEEFIEMKSKWGLKFRLMFCKYSNWWPSNWKLVNILLSRRKSVSAEYCSNIVMFTSDIWLLVRYRLVNVFGNPGGICVNSLSRHIANVPKTQMQGGQEVSPSHNTDSVNSTNTRPGNMFSALIVVGLCLQIDRSEKQTHLILINY